MSLSRREQLAEQLSEELRGLEARQIRTISKVFRQALGETVERISTLLDQFAAQPDYNPKTTPGAFLGSTPDGPVAITPEEKNLAAITLEGQLLQDLRRVLGEMELTTAQQLRIDRALRTLYDKAQELGTEYALQLVAEDLEPPLKLIQQQQGDRTPDGWPNREYREGQRFSRLFDLAGSVVAAERDFRSLADNYQQAAMAATDSHVAASKAYYAKWWRHWGDTVAFEASTQMAQGPDPRALKKRLQERIPDVNEAFRNRAETIARTETLMASGEAQERAYRRLNVGFIQYMATLDDRTCEYCAPRAGCIYWIGSVKAPIHPNCRCQTVPVTLEGMAIQNHLAKPGTSAVTWEQEAEELAASVRSHYQAANGEDTPMRPVGGPGEPRVAAADWPLMERTRLPQSKRRRSLPVRDTLNAASQPWPKGDPVWAPGRGWLDPVARQAYDALVAEVATLEAP